jgi:hypothetical protein
MIVLSPIQESIRAINAISVRPTISPPVAAHNGAPQFGFKTKKSGRPPSPKAGNYRVIAEGVVVELYTRLVAIGKFVSGGFPLYPWRIVRKRLPDLPKRAQTHCIGQVSQLGKELGFCVVPTLEDAIFTANRKKEASDCMKKRRLDPAFNKCLKEAHERPEVIAAHRERSSKQMRELHANSDFAAANRERSSQRMKERHQDSNFAAANRERSRKRLKELHTRPDFAAAQSERASKHMKALHADPDFAEATRKRMMELNADPAFAKANGERMKQQMKDPLFRQKLLAGIKRFRDEQKAHKLPNPRHAHATVNLKTGGTIDIRDPLAGNPLDEVIRNEEGSEAERLGKKLAKAFKTLDPVAQALLCDVFGIQAPPGKTPRKGATSKKPQALPDIDLSPDDREAILQAALAKLREQLT